MPIALSHLLGTRQAPTQSQNNAPPTASVTQNVERDPGMSKLVSASVTFSTGATEQLQAASGTFAAFAAGDTILVEGSALNDGTFLVTATDASTYLTVDGSCKSEGPVTATIRAI